jgi:hypoxanthine phosphoribosyltransferase
MPSGGLTVPDIDFYTWAEIDAICRELAAKIHEPFDVIAAVLRGGAIPGVILANHLGIDEVVAMKVIQPGQLRGAGKGGGAYQAEDGVVLVPLNPVPLEGKRVLVVDDVLDSGESMRLVLREIQSQKPAAVKLAVMQKKDYSRIEPDYYVEVKRNWLFYPWMSDDELARMKTALSAASANASHGR